MDDDGIRAKLEDEIGVIDAAALLPHHHRGALIMVVPELELLDVAEAVATNHAPGVQRLIEAGKLTNPRLWILQIDAWMPSCAFG